MLFGEVTMDYLEGGWRRLRSRFIFSLQARHSLRHDTTTVDYRRMIYLGLGLGAALFRL